MLTQEDATTLLVALRSSPTDAASLLWTALQGDPLDADHDRVSVAWLSDAYRSACGEAERASYRDATLLLFDQLPQRQDNYPAETISALCELARQIDLLITKTEAAQTVLWISVYALRRQRRSRDWIPIISFLATNGRKLHRAKWDQIFEEFGPLATLACVNGVAKHGSGHAIEWIHRHVPEEPQRDRVLRATLPWLVNSDPAGVVSIRRGPDYDLAKRVDEYLLELELTLPAWVTSEFVDSEDSFTAIYMTQQGDPDNRDISSYAEYDEINRSGNAPNDALESWLLVLQNAAIPGAVVEALRGDAE